jgi:hypothetical protein
MRRSAIEIVVVLFDVFAVIALAVGEAEQPLFEDRIFAVPQRERETKALLIVGNAGQTVFAPAIGARTSLLMTEVIPGIAIFAVILADGAPLAFAEVRSPFFPWRIRLARFG